MLRLSRYFPPATWLLIVSSTLAAETQQATPPSSITVPRGFEVELLRSAQPGEGSWISMTFDPQGRLIVGLDDVGLARLAASKEASDQPWTFERLDDTLKHCRGVLYAHDSLYVNATDSREFWRWRDRDADGQFEDRRLLQTFDYRSRYGHGQNQLLLGPDGMLYLVIGNDVSFPPGMSLASPYRNPQTDRLLPDPHDAGQDNRVGHIVKTDPDGREWTVIAGGLRNQVDAAFNADGEMFTWDADMEWDVGAPWYRPTRLNHIVSGGEYGWRWGTAKWPAYYEDSLPANLETGLGSPTGMVFGTGSQFPPRYRQALFMADWQHGRILAVTLQPDGASYTAEDQLFAEGGPLNVCDLTFGPEGALYFITGGRRSQSGLYRVRYTGPAEPERTLTLDEQQRVESGRRARALRRELEQTHTSAAAGSVDRLWQFLGSEDRWLRSAARVGLENQPTDRWTKRIFDEQDPLRRATALLAWVRVAPAEQRPAIVETLCREPLPASEAALLTSLRALSIALVRETPLSDALRASVMERLSAADPASSTAVRRELSELFVAVRAADALDRVLPWLAGSPSQEDQIHYVHALIRHRGPWTLSQRRQVLSWFRAARKFTGGHLFPTVLGHMHEDLLATLSDAERTELADLLTPLTEPLAEVEAVPARPIIQRWTLEELTPQLSQAASKRNWESAQRALAAASCLKCHRLGNSGAAIGPDLTSVGKRFDLRTIAESILEPSKVVDAKYHATIWELASGRVVTGRALQVSGQEITIEINPLTKESTKISRADIESSRPAAISPMPQGLLDTLTLDEVLDLLAYLRAGGNPGDAAFR